MGILARIEIYEWAVIAIGALLTAWKASTKHRNPLGWALFGGALPLLGLLILWPFPPLCPHCRARLMLHERKDGRCFLCGKRFKPC